MPKRKSSIKQRRKRKTQGRIRRQQIKKQSKIKRGGQDPFFSDFDDDLLRSANEFTMWLKQKDAERGEYWDGNKIAAMRSQLYQAALQQKHAKNKK